MMKGTYVNSKTNPERGFTFIKNTDWLYDLYWITQEPGYYWILDAKAELIKRYSLEYREFELEPMSEQQKVEMLEFLNENNSEANHYKDDEDPYFGPEFIPKFIEENFDLN